MTMREAAPPGYFTPREFAEIINVRVGAIYSYMNHNRLPYRKMGTRILIPADAEVRKQAPYAKVT